jgi:hypothetical protein
MAIRAGAGIFLITVPGPRTAPATAGGDIGFGVAADGTFELPCQAGGHIIQVQIGVPDDGWKTLGEGHVVAVADSTVTLEIRLTTVWPTVAP